MLIGLDWIVNFTMSDFDLIEMRGTCVGAYMFSLEGSRLLCITVRHPPKNGEIEKSHYC